MFHNDPQGIKQQIAKTLAEIPFHPARLLSVLRCLDSLAQDYDARAGDKRPLTLAQHTQMVLTQFDIYFADAILPTPANRRFFRLFLALHDIGKPRAVAAGDKGLQYQYTTNIINLCRDSLPITAEEAALALGLVSDDALGLYIRSRLTVAEARDRIIAMARIAHCGVISFFAILLIYYQVDAGSYTRDAFLGDPATFIAKPKIERLFVYDLAGRKVRHTSGLRLQFAPAANTLLESLEQEVSDWVNISSEGANDAVKRNT